MKSQWFQEITQLLRKQAHKCEAEKQDLRSYKHVNYLWCNFQYKTQKDAITK